MNSSNSLIWMFAWLIATVGAYKSGCIGGYCFVISDIQKNNERLDQPTAQQRCQSNGTQLVEIRNQDIQISLANFISSQGLNGWNVLTNGKRTIYSSWHRLSGFGAGGLIILEQIDASYSYGYLKPTTSGFNLCASRPADSKDGFICEGLSDCSGGVTYSGLCYKSSTQALSWYDARNRCLDGGGDLASFDYITSNAGFNALNGSWISTLNSYWIGIRRESWTWQGSNSDVKYSDWISGHPVNYVSISNSDCLCLSSNAWMWTECGCSQQLPFVCLSDNNSTTLNTAETPTRSSTITFTTTRTNYSATYAGTSTFESTGVSAPTIQLMLTSRSTPEANESQSTDKLKGLTSTEVGVAVGFCTGIPLIIAIVALAVIIVRLKKQLRQTLLSPESIQVTSHMSGIQKSAGTDLYELSVVTGGQYETLQPRLSGTATSDGAYQSLVRSNGTDSSVPSNNI